MNGVKTLLALMMLASSLWLATLLAQHIGDRISGVMVLTLTLLALFAFISVAKRRGVSFFVVLVLLAALSGYQLHGILQASPAPRAETAIRWQPLSEAAIAQAVADGKRVFVDISADWCVTCKVNEIRVLNQPEIIAALNAPDVVALRGDWSQPSDAIAAFLQKRNRFAIPSMKSMGRGKPPARSSRRCWTKRPC